MHGPHHPGSCRQDTRPENGWACPPEVQGHGAGGLQTDVYVHTHVHSEDGRPQAQRGAGPRPKSHSTAQRASEEGSRLLPVSFGFLFFLFVIFNCTVLRCKKNTPPTIGASSNQKSSLAPSQPLHLDAFTTCHVAHDAHCLAAVASETGRCAARLCAESWRLSTDASAGAFHRASRRYVFPKHPSSVAGNSDPAETPASRFK